MDLKGSLVDTKLRIYPSDKLKSFLENEKLGDRVPINIRKLIQSEKTDPETCNADIIPSNVYLNKTDIDNIRRIKNKIYPNGKCTSDQDNENNINGKSDEKALDKKLENGDCVHIAKTIEKEELKTDRKSNKQALDKSVDEECKNSSETGKNADNKNGLNSDEQVPIKNIKSEDCKTGKHGFLSTSDIDWLYSYIREAKSKGKEVPYLHELLEGSHIQLPENEIIKRNPVLEARCVKLRAQQEAREYRKMTKGVDNVRMKFPEDSISYQLKQMNRQLIAIGQFIISIFAGFLFGFRGVEWMVGNLDFGFRLLLGVMCALVIALAEIYFLAKKLNEELNVPETTQLGGPPTFADEKFNENKISKLNKPHQD